MLDSAVGLLTPVTRQSGGSRVSVWRSDTASVPDDTMVAAVIVVFPSNVVLANEKPPAAFQGACGGCHKAWRVQLPDKTFEIKTN